MRKLLSLFLALALLVIPAAGMADSGAEMMNQAREAGRAIRTDVTFTAGTIPTDEETAAIIADMLNALSFTVISDHPEEEGVLSFAMGLDGTDVLTIAGQAHGEDTYMTSSLLDDTVAYNQEELAEISKRITVLAAQSSGMSQEEIDAMLEGMSSVEIQPLDLIDAAEGFSVDEEAVAEVVARIVADAKEEPVTAASKDHDAAATQYTVVIKAEDFSDLYQILFDMLKNNAVFMNSLSTMLAENDEGMTAEELMAQLPAEYEKLLAQYEDVPCVLLLNEAGDMVHAVMTCTPKAGEDVPAVELAYNRLTTADGLGHSVAMTMTEEDESVIIGLNFLTESEKRTYFALTLDVQEADGAAQEVFRATLDATKDYTADKAHAAGTSEVVATDGDESMGLVIDFISDAERTGDDVQMVNEGKISLLGEKEPMVTVRVSFATCDKPADIVTDAAVRPGTMDDEAFNTYLTQVQASAMTNLMVIIQSLPMSVLSALMGS